jgi:hypothetical protein
MAKFSLGNWISVWLEEMLRTWLSETMSPPVPESSHSSASEQHSLHSPASDPTSPHGKMELPLDPMALPSVLLGLLLQSLSSQVPVDQSHIHLFNRPLFVIISWELDQSRKEAREVTCLHET